MKVLVTGTAGFIGFHVAKRLLGLGHQVCGIDALTPYYNIELKQARRNRLLGLSGYTHHEFNLLDAQQLLKVTQEFEPACVVHLAAQPGVRYSVQNPGECLQNNVIGFGNVLEACQQGKVPHLVYASSSSVYGCTDVLPYSVGESEDNKPVSLYAASKRANELMAHAYGSLYGIRTTGLRFFTVYGPWGRPDMALWLFSDAIMNGRPLKLFNHGDLQRDFTYVDDISKTLVQVVKSSPSDLDSLASVHNIGGQRSVKLLDFVSLLEARLGKKAKLEYLPMQQGDVFRTEADVESLRQCVSLPEPTPIETGLSKWAEWYLSEGRDYSQLPANLQELAV